MNKSALKTLAITAALTGVLAVSASAASLGGGTVQASALNLRSEPSTSSSILATSPKGSVVVVDNKLGNNWLKVTYRGQPGYMSSEFVTFSETLYGSFGKGKISGTQVRMRDGASLASNVLGTYDYGTEMQVLGISDGWYKLRYQDTEGYVFSDYLNLSTSNDSPADSTTGQTIVDTAMKYLSVPYVWAGTSPSGFDCSGLVYYVFKECGYDTNRTAASIYQNGTAVERSQLQIGDAICFSTGSSTIGHVGIYIGDDQFIHASSGSGYVKIDSLSTDYYNRNYYGARRII